MGSPEKQENAMNMGRHAIHWLFLTSYHGLFYVLTGEGDQELKHRNLLKWRIRKRDKGKFPKY